jgi:hypothetical protein
MRHARPGGRVPGRRVSGRALGARREGEAAIRTAFGATLQIHRWGAGASAARACDAVAAG